MASNAAKQTVVETQLLKQKNWSELESTDYKVYIENLRGFGCPEDTIKDIIIAEIDRLFLERFKTYLSSKQTNEQYWRFDVKAWYMARNTVSYHSEETLYEKQLQQERQELIKVLLGIDVGWLNLTSAMPAKETAKLDFLPEAKKQAVLDILGKGKAAIHKYTTTAETDANGHMTRETERQRYALHLQMEQELATLLTPEEYRRYELQASPLAETAREELKFFQPSQEEFARYYDGMKKFDEQANALPDNYTTKDWAALGGNKLERFKATLSPERRKEFQYSQNMEYGDLLGLSATYDLPTGTAISVHEIIRSAELTALKIRRDKVLNDSEKQLMLRAIKENATSAVAASLGQDAFAAFNKRGNTTLRLISD